MEYFHALTVAAKYTMYLYWSQQQVYNVHTLNILLVGLLAMLQGLTGLFMCVCMSVCLSVCVLDITI